MSAPQKRMFPVLGAVEVNRKLAKKYPEHPRCPEAIPWDVIAPYADQARANHYQTLERLAARGGLSPEEIACVFNRRPFPGGFGRPINDVDHLNAVMFVNFLLGATPTPTGEGVESGSPPGYPE